MSEEREKRPRPGGPGTTSDPNQSNRQPEGDRAPDAGRKPGPASGREPGRDSRTEQVRETPLGPVPGGPGTGPDPERRRNDPEDRQKR